MKKLLIILFLFTQLICQAEYNANYTLSITQKYAIPEDVSFGDHVGIWQKTVTWSSVGIINYSIEKNFNNAFAINPATGLITIADAGKINGQISQQDMQVNLIIRTTDSGKGFELDTAKIWVKENTYCKFIDYDYFGTESGTRAQPYNNLSDVTIEAGYGYFIKRGNTPANKIYSISGFQASSANPTIISAYATGNNPEFNGSGLTSANGVFYFLNTPSPSSYCHIYNIDVKNYPASAFRIATRSSHFGFYNCNFKANVLVSYSADLGDVYLYGSAADTLTNWGHELINLESEGSMAPILKTDASGVYAYNIKSATAHQHNFRFAISHYSRLSHFHFTGGSRSLQTRSPNVVISDGIITGASEAGAFLVTNATYGDKPNDLKIHNVLFKNNSYGIHAYNTNINRTIIEDCRFESNTNDGIYFYNGGFNRIIQRCSFINNGSDGIHLNRSSQTSTNLMINYNVFYGNNGYGINAANSNCATGLKIYNNTVVGDVELTGASTEIVQNNFFRSLTSAATASYNIDLDTINTSIHFQDYNANDYRLKSSAFSAINKGFPVSLTLDFVRTSVPQGLMPDIGAHEYQGGTTGSIQIQKNNKKVMGLYPNPTSGIVHVTFDNLNEVQYQTEWLNVTDLSGRHMLRKSIKSIMSDDHGEIDLSNLPKGFYLIGIGKRTNEKLALE